MVSTGHFLGAWRRAAARMGPRRRRRVLSPSWGDIMKSSFRKLVALVGGSVFVLAMGCAVTVESPASEEEVGEAEQAICAHAICSTGAKLSASCDLCVQKICAKDPYCCTSAWDSVC